MVATIGVIGETGQLARALARDIPAQGMVIKSLSRQDCDLNWSRDRVEAGLNRLLPIDVLIISAAYTAVDAAEENQDLAQNVNGHAISYIADFCEAHNIPVVHISTDYVFKGDATQPYLPTDVTDPINEYGASKLLGEYFLTKSGAVTAILRTSWVYDGVGKNFLTTMLRLGHDRIELNVVDDQIGRPTYAGDLSKAAIKAAKGLIADSDKAGIYHVSNTGAPISWAEFASAIFSKYKTYLPHDVTVNPIPSSLYPTPAKRPAYSVMDVTAFEHAFNMQLPSWQSGLNSAINEYLKVDRELNGT